MRASSGMIGTTRFPIDGSRSNVRTSRANAVVVLAFTVSPVPDWSSAYVSAAGNASGAERTTRSGSEPSSVRRRAIRYVYSGESVPGW